MMQIYVSHVGFIVNADPTVGEGVLQPVDRGVGEGAALIDGSMTNRHKNE